ALPAADTIKCRKFLALTEGVALTEGSTYSKSHSSGGSDSQTNSRTETAGRAQTLRSIFATLPTQAYTLEELRYFGSSLLGGLRIGEAVVKIGQHPPVQLRTLRIRNAWASPQQVDRLKQRLAA